MSEDTTRDVGEKYNTQPTIQTVLERLSSMEQSFNERLNSLEHSVNERLVSVEQSLSDLNTKVERGFEEVAERLEGLEGRAYNLNLRMEVLSDDVLSLRADERHRRVESFRKAQEESKPSGETP